MDSTTAAQGAGDVALIARRSGLVFLGGLVDRATRFATTWFLSGRLGSTGFGIYTLTTTIVTLTLMLAPLGADSGAILFGTRHGESGSKAELKGTIQTVLTLGFLGGIGGAVVVYFLNRAGVLPPAVHDTLPFALLAVVAGAPMAVLAGLTQASRSFRLYAVAVLVVLPMTILVGSALGVLAGGGPAAAVAAFVAAQIVALAILAVAVWRAHGGLLLDRSVSATRNVKEILSFSLPQSLAAVLWQFNLWTDVVMLGWLSTTHDVAVYRVALSIAMLGTLPVMALNTALKQRAAGLIFGGELDRLDHILKVGTHAILVVVVPSFMAVVLLSHELLGLFDPTYMESATVLPILLLGQILYVLTGPTNSLLGMGGYSRVELLNNVVAVVLNVGVNLLLIPRYGLVGAACTTVLVQIVWSFARTTEVKVLLRCFAFDRRSFLLLVVALGVVLAVSAATPAGSPLRIVSTLLVVPSFFVLLWKTSTEAELEMVQSVWAKAKGLLQR